VGEWALSPGLRRAAGILAYAAILAGSCWSSDTSTALSTGADRMESLAGGPSEIPLAGRLAPVFGDPADATRLGVKPDSGNA